MESLSQAHKKIREMELCNHLFRQLGIYPEITDPSGERPDILFRLEGIDCGMEVTTGASQDYQHLQALNLSGPSNVSRLGYIGPSRNRDELIREIGSLNCSSNPDQAWLHRIAGKISEKTKSLSQSGYRVQKENWLLIFDSQGPHHPAHWGPIYLGRLNASKNAYLHQKLYFDLVYIKTINFLFKLRDGLWFL